MDDTLKNLAKGDNETDIKPSSSAITINAVKRDIRNICDSFFTDSTNYLPLNTVECVKQYLESPYKFDRLLYSEISSVFVDMDEQRRAGISQNLEIFLSYVLENSDTIIGDAKEICIKIYDHGQLNLMQTNNAKAITERTLAEAIDESRRDLYREVREIQKEYITILGIFAAIILAFVGSFTFSTSVLNNVATADVYTLLVISLVIGLVFVILVTVLIDFLREINNKNNGGNSNFFKRNPVSGVAVIILAILIVVTVCCHYVSQIDFPDYYIVQHDDLGTQ